MDVTGPFAQLLDIFQDVFTAPSFARFVRVMTGWVMSPRRRFITDTIVSSDSTDQGHFSSYHRLFSRAAWSLDALWQILATLLVNTFVGPDATILLCGDDTLCRKRGLTLFGAGMHHDPLISSRAMKLVSWGHDWVVLCLLVVNPWWSPGKVFALPICARLYKNRQGLTKGQKKNSPSSRASTTQKSKRPAAGAKAARRQARKTRRKQGRATAKAAQAVNAQSKVVKAAKTGTHRTRPELMLDMLQLVSQWFPDRKFCLLVDSLYSGKSILRNLPGNIDLIGHVHPKGTLYEPAPAPRPGQRGRPTKRGERLPDRDTWAADSTRWNSLKFDQFGLHATLQTKTRQGLYYKAGKDRLLKFVLTRDTKGDRPQQIFYCTDLTLSVREILSRYSCRWAIEVTFEHSKQLLGLEDPANRTELAVQRTAPMALVLYSLTVVWYQREGHRHVRFPDRPWYQKKEVASFGDMLTTLRRRTWEEMLNTAAESAPQRNHVLKLLTYLATLAG